MSGLDPDVRKFLESGIELILSQSEKCLETFTNFLYA